MNRRMTLGLTVAVTILAAPLVWAKEKTEEEKKKADTAVEASYHERLKQVRLIEIRHLRSGNATEFRKGRQKILAIEDEAVVGPLVHVLYGPNNRYRSVLIDALHRHAWRGSDAAKAYLQEVAVGDGTRGLRRRAVQAIKASTLSGEKPATERLMAHLALDEVSVLRNRAAAALAALNEKRAVWIMVERLLTEEFRLTGADIVDYHMQLDIRAQWAGTPTFRQRTISAAVPGMGIATTTIDLPQVEIVDLATTVAMTERHTTPVYERVEVKHPKILTALKQLTGKDFGYDQAAWHKWLQSNPKGIPAWEPIRFKAEGQAVKVEE